MKRLIVLTLVLVLSPLAAGAQSIELTPTFGYRWGGELSASSNELFDRDMDVENGSSYGLSLGILVGRHSQIELFASRQETRFGEERLFAPPADGIDVDVTYYHVGYLYQWTPGRVNPYVTASLGVTSLDPDVPGLSSEEKVSFSLGGGLKVMASRHVGFRLDGRFFWTDTGNLHHRDWDDCRDDCWEWDDHLVQNELKVGVIFQF